MYNCCQCAIVHSDKQQRQSDRHPRQKKRWLDSSEKRLLLSSLVPGLGWSCWGRSKHPSNHYPQHEISPVFVHLHHLGVLPYDGPALCHAPADTAHNGHPSAVSVRSQVSPQFFLIFFFCRYTLNFICSTMSSFLIDTWCKLFFQLFKCLHCRNCLYFLSFGNFRIFLTITPHITNAVIC